jgi:hypothetical protein
VTPLEALLRHLRRAAAPGAVAVVHDAHGLLDLDGATPVAPWTVLRADSNLGFRFAWEAQREQSGPWLIVRRGGSVFLADLELRAAADGLLFELTPRRLLALVSGREGWPAWLDGESALVASQFSALLRGARRLPADAEAGAVEALCVHAMTGLDTSLAVEPAEAWQALFEHAELLTQLHTRRAAPAARLQAWLKEQTAPLCWIDLGDPTRAVRLTWLTALLAPHVPDAAELLACIHPGAGALKGQDATAVARVAYRLARRARRLAQGQLAQAEAALAGSLRGAVVRHLHLDEPDGAAAVLRRERHSGLLVLFALRTLLAAAVSDTPADPRLEADVEGLLARAEELSEPKAVAAHARLLLALLRLARYRRLAAALPASAAPEAVLRRALAWLVDHGLAGLPREARTAWEALGRNAVAEPAWSPRADEAAHKQLLRAICRYVAAAEEAFAEFERRVVGAAVDETVGEGAAWAKDGWSAAVAPILADAGAPKLTVALVAGLSWSAWEEHLAPRLAALGDCHARAVLARPPACAAESLRRALGTASAGTPWAKLARQAHPDLAWRTARPPAALAALAECGALAWSGSAARLRVVVVDLLAGGNGGVPTALWRRRIEALGDGLAGLLEARRDEAVVVLATSGAVLCDHAAGLAWPGQSHGARGLLLGAEAEAPPDCLALDAGRLGLSAAPGEVFHAAVGRQRLSPAAREVALADGGLSLDELAVPQAVLTPAPAGEASTVVVGALSVPHEVSAGGEARVELGCTLTGGALAELATLSLDMAGVEPCAVTLDLGERRRLAVTFRVPSSIGELVVNAECRVGRRVFRRRAVLTVVAPGIEEEAEAGRRNAGASVART